MKNKKINEELLSKRVFFVTEHLRNQFFDKLREKFGSWINLRRYYKIYKSKLERYRYGEHSIPYHILIKLMEDFSDEDKKYFLSRITLKDKNWGRSKGGKTTYKKHKYIFENGRKLAIKRNKKGKYNFPFDMPLTKELCELIGAFIGDGFTNSYNKSYMIQFTGHLKLDKEYIEKTIKKIIRKLCPDANPIITEKENTLRLTIYSKDLYNLLTKRFGFPAGKKTYTVTVPDEIINSKNFRLINYCIRGIFDTDGCVFFDKRSIYNTPYIRIALHIKSKELVKQIHSLLLNQDINSKITKDLERLQVNGFKNCKKFIKKIGFSNKRHLDKIKF